MDWHKSHLKVNTRKLWSQKHNAFTLHRHSLHDLSLLLVSNSKARDDNLSSYQKIELDSFHRDAIFDLRNNITGYPRSDVLKAYFYLFDELFFCRSLGDHCDLRFSVVEPRTDGAELTGRTESLGKGRNRLTIYLRRSEERTRWEAMSRYVGTLLHEMIHVFMFCWACDHGRCADAIEEDDRGHGLVWQDVTYALELAANDRRLLDLNISLERAEMLALEVHRTRKWPAVSQLAGWSISQTELRARYQIFGILEERRRRELLWKE
ncbi:hypothetical protein N431DRAFT_463852 [Stipitochalara longipes BDJ]|nr:hypothetical protein N431DRAFT_463852 [Stipitochalara longipes BDJ]